MWRRELFKNKLYSLILIGIGALSVLLKDTFLYFIDVGMCSSLRELICK